MKRVHFLFSFLVSVLLLSTSVKTFAFVGGKRIVVDKTSTTNSGTSFSSIKMAVDSAVYGDTVIIKEGTYKEKIRSNTSIVIGSEFLLDGLTSHIQNTIISGDSVTQNATTDALVYSGGSDRDTSYFKLIGLTVTNASKYAVYISFGTIRNCILQNSGSTTTVPFVLTGSNISNTKFSNNIGMAVLQFDWINHGFQPSATISNNIFINNKALGVNGYQHGQNNSGILYFNGSGARVFNNIFYNNAGDNIFSISGKVFQNIIDTFYIVHNTIYKNNTRTAFFRTWDGQNQPQVNFIAYFINNIIDNNYLLSTQSNAKGEFMWTGSNARNSKTYFRNNLMASTLNQEQSTGYSAGFYTFDFDNSNKVGDASLVDTAALNFALSSNSNGFGMGYVSSDIPAKDYLDNNRPLPSGTLPDVGAFESTSSMPIPRIAFLKNSISNAKPVVQVKYSIFNAPAIDSIILYRDSVLNPTTPTKYATIKYYDTASGIFIDSTNLSASKTYLYKIKSKINTGTILSDISTTTDTVKIPASTSAVLKPSALALSSPRVFINLSWTLANSSGNTYVDIYRGASLASASLIATIEDSSNQYNDTTTTLGTKYFYYLVNRDRNGVVSEASESANFTTSNTILPTTWYVNINATSNGVGSSASPFKTLAKGLSNAIKGDKIVLLPGTYSGKISIAPGVVIGSRYLVDNSDTASIRSTIINATGLKGTIITYSNTNSTYSNNTRTSFIGLSFTGVSGTARLFNNTWGNPSSITLDHCLVYNNGNQTIASDPNGNYEDVTKYIQFGDSTIISNSIFENNYGRIRFDANSFVVKNNIFRNNNQNMVKPSNNWIRLGVLEGWVNGNNNISGNIFYENGTYENAKQNGGNRQNFIAQFGGSDTLFFVNNTFVSNLNQPISFDNNGPVSYVVNNIFHKNDADFYVVPWASQFNDLYVENNFFSKNPQSSSALDKLNVSYSNNLIGANPNFSDSVNMVLSASSSLINSGKNSYGKNSIKTVNVNDINGSSRPSPAGSNSDIGAVENTFGFPAPTLISVDGSDKSITLKWSKPLNGVIAGYSIFRSTSSIADNSTAAANFTIASGDTLTYKDTALTNLTKYYYRIKAFTASQASFSGFSNELNGKPNVPPSGVDTVFAYGGTRSVVLQWSDTSAVKRKYNIYRGIISTSLDKIASNIDTTFYVDNSANANVKYYYGIRVVDSVGAASNISKLANTISSNIWVIDTAGKSTGNGSSNFPLKSIQFAIDNSVPGDTIILNNGTYAENLEVFSKVLVLKAKNIGKAIIIPATSGKTTLSVQDLNQCCNLSDYPKAKNKFIGLTFSNNTNTQWGTEAPAAVNVNQMSNPIFESCTFSNNSSQYVFSFDRTSATFVNCLIINNTVQSGIFNNGYQDTTQARTNMPRFINSIFDNNSFFSRNCCGQEGSIYVFNSIISNNGYDNNFNEKLYRVINSVIDNPKFAKQSATNQIAEPQFNNPSSGDYSLSNFSPALGKGLDKYVIGSAGGYDTLRAVGYDFNYATRPNPTGTNADLGAFENKYSIAAPQITRLQKTGTAITITWAKTDSTVLSDIKMYRDTLKTALDTIAPLALTVDLTTKTIADVLPNANKEYFYAIRATVGSGANAVKTGLSNIKSSKDTIFVPTLNFIADTASIKIRAASRQGNGLGQSVNLVKLAADGETALPKLIVYSQEFRQIDSTKRYASDSLTAINLLAGSGLNKIKLALNKTVLVAKGKNDYMQLVSAMNVNGDDEFDLVGIYRNSTSLNQQAHIAYLTNNNLSLTLDTVKPPTNFFNPNINSYNQSTNLSYKWDQKTFQFNDNATSFGQNIEAAAEFMDGNFDGKEELIVSLQQVKWEPNSTLNYGNNTSIYQTSSSVRPVKFVDINNDGIPDIFAMTNWPWALGLGQVNGNPMVVFVSNKKDGKFYMHVTGINVDWGASLYFGDFKNSRTTQVLTRVNGGNYKVYDFDKNYSATSAEMQVNGVLNDGKIAVGDMNNDGYPDVVTIDNSGNFVAFLNNHRGDFTKKVIGSYPYASNNIWSTFNLKMLDLNQDGAKDLMWFEGVPESDGSYNWNSNNFYVRTWLQEVGDQKRTAPAKISASDVKVSNDGYNVKIKWTPSKDAIDPYIFANVKVDTLDTYKSARINNSYNYRQGNPAIPIVLDRVYARNYPDSLTFNDVNLSSKKAYYVKVQMVNQEGQASDFAEKVFSPKDPLASIDNAIPGLQNARFAWGDYNNDALLDIAVMGQSDNGNVTKVYQNTGSAFVDLNLTNRAFRYGDIKWVDLNNDGWLDVAIIGQPGAGVGFQVLLNNKGVFEVKTPSSVAGLKYSNMAFGDYDNNGTLDMFTSGQDATGNAHSYLYKNDGLGNFSLVPELNEYNIIPNMYDADARFIDYDLDGDLDLVYSGTDQNNGPTGGVRVNTILDPKLTTNNYGNNGNFNNGYSYYLNAYNNDCQCNLGLAMKQARFDIGDIDGDGDLDIVEIGLARKYTGQTFTDNPQLIIIRNQTIETKNAKFGNYFSYGSIYNISASILDSIYNGDVKLVDFNNDGLLDITVTGLDKVDVPVTRFYLNQGGFGNFTLSNNTMIPQYSKSAISWGDANGDGSMDLVISGNKLVGSSTSIFINDQGSNNNVAPSIPQNLTFIDQGQGRVLLQWDPSTDDHTVPSNLYYNLKLGTKPGLSDLRVIQVNPTTDKLLTPNTSLIGSTKYYIELPPGVFYWSVQAVDGNYSSSKFADNQKIVLKYPWQFVNQGGIVDTRIKPLENPAFAWADVSNSGVFDFLYLGTGSATNDQNNTPVGLYKNVGANFIKLKNDSTQTSGGYKGTGFGTNLAGIANAQIRWVDLDNDGKLDLVVAGNDVSNGKGRLSIYRNRGNYKFENITGTIYNATPLSSPKIEFIDLDNNGLKDFVYTGLDVQGLGQFKFIGLYKDSAAKSPIGDLLGYKAVALKNNLDVLLTSAGISNVNLAVGDLNKDLKPDFAILYDDDNGIRKGEVYNNTSDTSNNITFVKSATISLPKLNNSTLDLIDYNNDGLLDLALSGTSQATGQIFRIYQNKWLDSAAKTIQFVQSNSAVLPFENGQTTWGDINSDGYPDIIFSGSRAGKGKFSAMALADPSTVKVNGILKYNELPTFPFGDYSLMRPSLGDFSSKKVLDLVLVGTEKVTDPIANTSSNVSSFKILKNVRALSALVKDSSVGLVSIGASTGSIKSMSTALTGISTLETSVRSNSVRGFADSTIAVADSNYLESSYGLNNAPTSPKIDTSIIISRVDSVSTKYLVSFNWKAASDDNTPSSGLTYAVSIGTKSGASDILDPNASITTGTRKTPEAGNAGKNLSITQILAPGTYYWTVQSIDASNAGSKFTGTRIIQVNSNRTLVERSAPYDILLNNSSDASYFLKQNDSTGVKFNLTASHNDSTAKLRYSIISDTGKLFKIDTVSNILRLSNKPSAAAYSLQLRVTDNYGIYFDKLFTFRVIQAPSKLLVNNKDTSYIYYTNLNADSAKLTLQLNATYDPVPSIDPVLTYKFVTGTGGDNNGLFDLAGTILINKRKLNDADTIKLRVSASDVYGLSVERFLYLINTTCPTKPSITVKASAVACLPVLVNLTDSLITNGTNSKGLTFGYFSDINTTNKVLDPTKVATSGTYYIKAFDSTGCGIAKPIVVNVASQPAKPTVTVAAACQNQTVIPISYTAPSTKVKLVWYGNNATGGTPSTSLPTFNTSAPTTLSFYVGQADTVAGCYSDRIKLDILVKPTPVAPSISRDTAGNLVSSVGTGLTWYKDTSLVSTAASFKPSGPGSYTVKTTNDGCMSVASNAYYYIVTDLITLSSTEYIKLAPNPFVNFLNFDFVVKGYQKLNIDVFETSTGTRVSSRQGVYAGSRLSFADLSAGVYIFKVTSSDGKLSYQFKMIKL